MSGGLITQLWSGIGIQPSGPFVNSFLVHDNRFNKSGSTFIVIVGLASYSGLTSRVIVGQPF